MRCAKSWKASMHGSLYSIQKESMSGALPAKALLERRNCCGKYMNRAWSVVEHRQLILPSLGASGVAAHEVTKKSRFSVIYGPVRASDIPAFLKAGMVATPEMRKVRFPFFDRIVLTPVELIMWANMPFWWWRDSCSSQDWTNTAIPAYCSSCGSACHIVPAHGMVCWKFPCPGFAPMAAR